MYFKFSLKEIPRNLKCPFTVLWIRKIIPDPKPKFVLFDIKIYVSLKNFMRSEHIHI